MKDIRIDARNSFEPDKTFMIEKTTINAWGIWDDKKNETKEVRLRFSSAIAERVISSKWHKSEITEPQPDGSLLFSVTIAEPLEMLTWIRRWGANVEILEPVDLRERFRDEVRRMTKTYGLV
jgi:predicted DNA-binding transcriptional regulator YafY